MGDFKLQYRKAEDVEVLRSSGQWVKVFSNTSLFAKAFSFCNHLKRSLICLVSSLGPGETRDESRVKGHFTCFTIE